MMRAAPNDEEGGAGRDRGIGAVRGPPNGLRARQDPGRSPLVILRASDVEAFAEASKTSEPGRSDEGSRG